MAERRVFRTMLAEGESWADAVRRDSRAMAARKEIAAEARATLAQGEITIALTQLIYDGADDPDLENARIIPHAVKTAIFALMGSMTAALEPESVIELYPLIAQTIGVELHTAINQMAAGIAEGEDKPLSAGTH
jgi:hypothetical protein